MYCYRCGNQLPEASLYCNRCGTRVRPRRDQWQTDRDRSATGRPRAVHPEAPDPFEPRAQQSEAKRSRRTYVDPQDSEPPFIDSPPETDWELNEENWEEEWEETAEGEDWENDEEPLDEEVEDLDGDLDATTPRHPPSRREQVIFSINPAFYPVTTAYLVSSFFAVVLTAGLAYFNVNLLFVLLTAVATFVPAIVRHIQHIHTVFTLTTFKIEISTGLLSKKTQNIPLRHIQDVSVRESLSERLLGIGDIIVDAPAMESNTTLSNVREPRRYADLILGQIQRWNA